MTVAELRDALSLTQLSEGEAGLDNQVADCYIGDLLSWVMGRAPGGSAWITVMGNVNAVAVAQLADIACIVLCEGAHLDDEAREKAVEHAIPILAGEENAFRLGLRIAAALGIEAPA